MMRGTSSSRLTLVIALALAVLAVLVFGASTTHGATFDPAACKPGYIIRVVRQGLPRCVRAVYVPRGVK